MRFRVTADDEFAFIPEGSFTMGRTSGDTDSDAPSTSHFQVLPEPIPKKQLPG